MKGARKRRLGGPSMAIPCGTLAVLLAIACGSSSSSVCDPGATRTCVGAGQCPGGQSCLEEGSGWTTCDCTVSGAAGASSGVSMGGAEGTNDFGGASGNGSAASSGGDGSGPGASGGSGGLAGEGGADPGQGGTNTGPTCTPGAREFCDCANVPRGARTCDGFGEWGPCECVAEYSSCVTGANADNCDSYCATTGELCAPAACDGLTWVGWYSASSYCTNFLPRQASSAASCSESVDSVPILRCCCTASL